MDKTDKLIEKVVAESYNEGNRNDMGDLARRGIEAGMELKAEHLGLKDAIIVEEEGVSGNNLLI